MDALLHFFAMGGYALFVWPAYGAAALVLGAFTFESLLAYRRTRRDLAAIERRPR